MTFKRVLVIVLALVMVAAFFAGCDEKEEPSSTPIPVDLTLSPDDPYTFSFLWPFANQPMWAGTKIGDWVTEQTGLTVEFLNTVGDSNEYHNLLVASRDFPDVVTIAQGAQLATYLEGDCLQPLTDLILDRAPQAAYTWNLDKNGNMLDKWTSMCKAVTGEDEDYILGMSVSASREDQSPVTDYMSADLTVTEMQAMKTYLLFPTVTEFTDTRPTTLSEVYDLLVAYQAEYGGDGVHYATSVYPGHMSSLIEYANHIYGDKANLWNTGLAQNTQDGTFYAPFMSDYSKDFFIFLNQLYREGLMNPQGPLQSEDDCIAEYSNGNIFSMFGTWWVVAKANVTFLNTESMSDMMYIPDALIRGDGYTGQVWHSNQSKVGWRMVGVTEDMEKPEKYLEFIEWYYTTPGVEMVFGWGFEGEDWVVNSDGVADTNADIVATHTGDYYFNLGLSAGDAYSYMWAFMPLPSKTLEGYAPGHNGAPYEQAAGDPRFDALKSADWFWSKDYVGQFYIDTKLTGVQFDSTIKNKYTVAIANLQDDLCNVIMATSEADAIAKYDAIRDAFAASDGVEWVDYINGLYNQ